MVNKEGKSMFVKQKMLFLKGDTPFHKWALDIGIVRNLDNELDLHSLQ